MRISALKSDFLEDLNVVSSVITSKNTLPILSNLLIEARKRVELIATDLDIGITIEKDVEILEEGAITAPAKRFVDILKELPEGKVEIYTKKNHMVIIEGEGVQFKILGIPKEEFPTLPKIEEKEEIIIKQKELKEMLLKTSFSMSQDETRYVLNGICFLINKEEDRMVATDGRRLSIATRKKTNKTQKNKKAIIPTKTIQILIQSLEEEGDVKIKLTQNQIMFILNKQKIISRLIEGEFPNYEQAIPKENKNKIIVDKSKLQASIKRANLLTTPESQAIKLQTSKNKLQITKTTPEIGETKEEVEAQYTGEDLLVGFNPQYLLDVLKAIDEEKVQIEVNGPDKPAVIRVNNEEYIYIVLPMQLT